MIRLCKTLLSGWLRKEDGLAAVEAALVFPILALLLVGTFDMGNAILANQKIIRASQVTADLITRAPEVDNSMINEAIWGGELALSPLTSNTYGVDIVSIRFNEDAEPQIEWRETRNMNPNPDVLDAVISLADEDGGVVMVTIQYTYNPVFAGFSMKGFSLGELPMQEVAFSRGRRSAVVERI